PEAEGEKKALKAMKRDPMKTQRGTCSRVFPTSAMATQTAPANRAKFQGRKGGQKPETRKTVKRPYSIHFTGRTGRTNGLSGLSSSRAATAAKIQVISGI